MKCQTQLNLQINAKSPFFGTTPKAQTPKVGFGLNQFKIPSS